MKLLYKKYIIVSWLVLSAMACIFLYSLFYNWHRGCDITSMNDEWEHQSMAVNYAKGYGIYKLGVMAPVEEYHLDACDQTFPFLRKLITTYPVEYYHRMCGFSIITGTLYKFTGTAPVNLRIFNFILLILSWLLICRAASLLAPDKKFSRLLLYALPVFLIINFPYIDLIGDDTLIIFCLSLIFLSLTRWLQYQNTIRTLAVVAALLFSLFIKSTLFFIPVFLLLFAFFTKQKKMILYSAGINVVLFAVVFICSAKINELHRNFNYPEQVKFHNDLTAAEWSKEDSDFIKQYHLHYKDIARFDFKVYKQVAAYLYERQFYTKRPFLMSGQSLFLLIDGNNEACVGFPEKHIGNWKPFWKILPNSFYYHYTGESSPYAQIISFYVHHPIFLPLILYSKLDAGYHWSYLFLILAALQFFLALLLYAPRSEWNGVFVLAGSILFHFLLNQFHLTPLIVLSFLISFIYIAKKMKIAGLNNRILYFLPYSFICYFIFLTLLLFGLDRYTGIANGILILAIFNLYRPITAHAQKSKWAFTLHPKYRYAGYTFGVVFLLILTGKFGVSNNDEFLSLISVKYKSSIYYLEVVNVVNHINSLFFSTATIYHFRLTKIIFNTLNFALAVWLLYKILLKTNEQYVRNFRWIYVILLLAAMSFQFNRGIHYNDVLDFGSMLTILMVLYMYFYPDSKLNFPLVVFHAGFALLLFMTKFPLGIYSILSIVIIILYSQKTWALKLVYLLAYLVLFSILLFIYITENYHTLDALFENYRFFRSFFNGKILYVYLFDVILFIAIALVTVLLIIKKNTPTVMAFRNKFSLKKWFFFLIAAEIFLYLFRVQNRLAYFLYYCLFDGVIFCSLTAMITTVYYSLITSREYRKAAFFTYFISFLFLCLWGSMTLQLVNVALHPFLYFSAILLGLYYLKKEYLLKNVLYFSLLFFIICTFFNPFIYNNYSVFQMNVKTTFPGKEELYINEASRTYYEDTKKFLAAYKDAPIVDFDFLNVLYYADIAPYLEPNFVDDQPADISCAQLKYFKGLGKGSVRPKLTIGSSPMDTAFYSCLDNYYAIRLGKTVFVANDPTSSVFKKLKSNDSVYINEIIHK